MDIVIHRVIRKEPEHIVLKVIRNCNLSPYIIFDTTYDENGNVSNINRHSYFFGNKYVEAGDYIILYSGIGTRRIFLNNAKTNTHVFYWGFESGASVWNDECDKALLVKVADSKNTSL